MIEVTRLNGESIFVNPDLIYSIEKCPDTLLRFSNGQVLAIKESPREIQEKVVEFKKRYIILDSKDRFLS